LETFETLKKEIIFGKFTENKILSEHGNYYQVIKYSKLSHFRKWANCFKIRDKQCL